MIKVSVCCLAYNHESFIRYALDSILKQKVNFEYEIIIHDDASTDKTTEIIKNYADRYPDIIKPIYQKENQYSMGINPSYLIYEKASGEYLAFCECDDFWTDDNKLQKQIDFLENNHDYIAVSHNIYVVDEHNSIKNMNNEIRPSLEEHDITDYKELGYTGGICGQTATIVCRHFWKKLDEKQKNIFKNTKVAGDQKLNLYFALYGKIKVFSDVMSAYRITYNTDSWTSQNYGKRTILDTYNCRKELQNMGKEICGIEIVFSLERLICTGYINLIKFHNKKHFIDLFQVINYIPKSKSKIKILIGAIGIFFDKIFLKLKINKKIGNWKIIPKVKNRKG